MKEEVKKILKMIEEKKITAEEGEKLIDALGENEVPAEDSEKISKDIPKYLRVHVNSEDDKVDINVPLSLVEVGLKLGTKFGALENENLKDIDFNMVMQAIKDGARGKIVDVKSSDSTVEVYVD